ncbi:MAG TPA: hypothetical protein DDW50_03120, partial [Firmicutes bacterium]|nr:hypothetical protein [Bacillota bacterium]
NYYDVTPRSDNGDPIPGIKHQTTLSKAQNPNVKIQIPFKKIGQKIVERDFGFVKKDVKTHIPMHRAKKEDILTNIV